MNERIPRREAPDFRDSEDGLISSIIEDGFLNVAHCRMRNELCGATVCAEMRSAMAEERAMAKKSFFNKKNKQEQRREVAS